MTAPTPDLDRYSDAEVFDRYYAVMDALRKAADQEERRRIWLDAKPLMEELGRRYPPATTPLN